MIYFIDGFNLQIMNKRKCVKKLLVAIRFKSNPKDLYTKYEVLFKEKNVTALDMESSAERMDTLAFLDESRKLHKCMLSSIDFSSGQEYRCFWDHHPIPTGTTPIGCPLRFVPDITSRTYFSEITKDKFTVKESMLKGQQLPSEFEMKVEPNNYYETDGIFCSFNCCLAFIQKHKKEFMYKDSELLLHRIHNEIFEHSKITPAPDWRILKEYGGSVDIISFRTNFSKIVYDFKGIYKPYFKPIAFAFEERIKF